MREILQDIREIIEVAFILSLCGLVVIFYIFPKTTIQHLFGKEVNHGAS